MYIQLYALYIDTCISSNMDIHLYALYIEERQGVRIPDDDILSRNPGIYHWQVYDISKKCHIPGLDLVYVCDRYDWCMTGVYLVYTRFNWRM